MTLRIYRVFYSKKVMEFCDVPADSASEATLNFRNHIGQVLRKPESESMRNIHNYEKNKLAIHPEEEVLQVANWSEKCTFADALTMLQSGLRMTRAEWMNSDGPITQNIRKSQGIYIKFDSEGINNREGYLEIERSDGSKMLWSPKQEDLFATDWKILKNNQEESTQ